MDRTIFVLLIPDIHYTVRPTAGFCHPTQRKRRAKFHQRQEKSFKMLFSLNNNYFLKVAVRSSFLAEGPAAGQILPLLEQALPGRK